MQYDVMLVLFLEKTFIFAMIIYFNAIDEYFHLVLQVSQSLFIEKC